MSVKRLFIGTFIDSSLFSQFYPEFITEMDEVVRGKWTESHNLHFTYKFLGNVEESEIDNIKESLNELLIEHDTLLKINGIGAFPTVKKPKIIYTKVFNPGKAIFSHFQQIEAKMLKLGFQFEKKKFLPHVTLLRVKGINSGFADKFKSFIDTPIGIMPSYRVNLVESTLTTTGPIYKILA